MDHNLAVVFQVGIIVVNFSTYFFIAYSLDIFPNFFQGVPLHFLHHLQSTWGLCLVFSISRLLKKPVEFQLAFIGKLRLPRFGYFSMLIRLEGKFFM